MNTFPRPGNIWKVGIGDEPFFYNNKTKRALNEFWITLRHLIGDHEKTFCTWEQLWVKSSFTSICAHEISSNEQLSISLFRCMRLHFNPGWLSWCISFLYCRFVFHRVSPICVPSVVIVAGNSTWNSRALHGALSSSSLYSSLGKKWYKIEIDFLEIL